MLVQLVNHLAALKKNPFICLGLGEKKAQRHSHGFQEKLYQNSEILKPRQIGGVEQVLSTQAEQLP